VIDYNDQVWLPWALGLRSRQYDAIFVDESQDLNEAQFQLLLTAAGANGRMVFVGDPFQAIYGFRGAGIGMIDHVKKELEEGPGWRGVLELPLNYCYRCPKLVIEHVHRTGHVTKIEACPEAIAGEVLSVKDSRRWESAAWREVLTGDVMILCRTNAPLVSGYFKLLKLQIPASIKGRGEGGMHKQVVSLINRCKGAGGLPGLVGRARKNCQRQVEVLWKARRQGKATNVSDLFEVLLVLAEESGSVESLRSTVDCIFKADKDVEGIVLSTVHRAKGLEGDTVVVLRPDLLPMKFFARTESEMAQEMNLEYVCCTRPKKRLVFASPEKGLERRKALEDLFPGINLRREM
jgi:superfamily I DNA/RNA helicase